MTGLQDHCLVEARSNQCVLSIQSTVAASSHPGRQQTGAKWEGGLRGGEGGFEA